MLYLCKVKELMKVYLCPMYKQKLVLLAVSFDDINKTLFNLKV